MFWPEPHVRLSHPVPRVPFRCLPLALAAALCLLAGCGASGDDSDPPTKGARALSPAPVAARPAPEAEIRVVRLSVDDGLSQSTVTSVVQGRDGFLWIGTEGGLDRYDGYTFTPYRNEPGNPSSLSSSFVTSLAETPDGALWVGTHGAGLNRLDPASGVARRLRHDSTAATTLSADRVGALFADRQGRLWAGTERGLDRVDLRTAEVTRVAQTPEVKDIAQDPDSDALWVATLGGLWRVDPETGQTERAAAPATLGSDQINAVWPDDDGTFWVGTADAGLTRVDPETGEAERLPSPGDGPEAADVQDILRDSQGTLWVATRSGLARYDAPASGAPEVPAWTVIGGSDGDPTALSTSTTRTLAEDRTGIVWVGTWSHGLNGVRRTPFRRFAADAARPGGLSSSDIMGMAQEADGTLWVGTYDRGLNRLDLASGVATQEASWPAELRTEGVRSVTLDGEGALWATGGPEGLWRRDTETERWARVPFEADAGVERVLYVTTAPDGSVWTATYGGGPCHAPLGAAELTCPARTWTGAGALRSDLAYTVFPEADGRVWVSLWGSGADLIDPARGRVLSVENRPTDLASLSENNVTSFFRDASGDLWLTTYGGGLNRLLSTADGGQFAHVTERDGLPNGTTYGILTDASGHFWVSTNRGLAHLDPASGDVIATYGPDDGLPGAELNGYSFLGLNDGRMAFGGLGGLAIFDPERAAGESPPPEAAVTAVRVLGRETDYPPGGTEPLVLSHRQSAVAFDVAAMDFASPDDNRYAFRLDGMDDSDWSPPSRRRTAAYTNLEPGAYTFRVRASGAGGVWNESALAIPITVRPAWWQTWTFRLLAGLGLLGAIVFGVREASQRRLRAEVRRLETEQRVQAERERISRDLHDHVGGQLSGLIASAELARLQRRASGATRDGGWETRDGAPEADADALARIEDDARETMRQLRETVWALHHEAITLGGFRDRLRTDLDARLRGHARPRATVDLDGDADHLLSPLQALHLYRVAREAITNSLKHADADRLSVTIRQRPETVSVEVSDDGTFREASGASGVSGFGLGSMRARAEALRGRLDLRTDQGTSVCITVPAERKETSGPPDGTGNVEKAGKEALS